MLKKKISDRAKDEGILQEALLIVVDLLKSPFIVQKRKTVEGILFEGVGSKPLN